MTDEECPCVQCQTIRSMETDKEKAREIVKSVGLAKFCLTHPLIYDAIAAALAEARGPLETEIEKFKSIAHSARQRKEYSDIKRVELIKERDELKQRAIKAEQWQDVAQSILSNLLSLIGRSELEAISTDANTAISAALTERDELKAKLKAIDKEKNNV